MTRAGVAGAGGEWQGRVWPLPSPAGSKQRAAPWHAAAIPGAAGLPEKAPAGYFRVGSESPLAGCQGLHNTCRGCPPPCHHAPGKAQLLFLSLSAPQTPWCSREPSKLAPAPPWGVCSELLGLGVCLGMPGRGRTCGDRAPCPFPHPLQPRAGCCAGFAAGSLPWGVGGGSGDGQPELSPAGRG